jgi:diguanylate cyclase (GGDEF)-like protein
MAIQSLSDNNGLASNSSLSSIFYLWGIWLFAKGFALRSQVKTWPKIAFVLGAITVGLLTYFSLVDDQLLLRIIIINLGLASISLLGIKGCFNKSRRDDPLHKWISLAYIALILLEIARAIIGFNVVTANPHAPLAQSAYWQILLASSMLISLAFACLLIASLFHDLMRNMKNDIEKDDLTSLLNRRGFNTRANHLLNQQQTRRIFVLMCDIDHFKSFNDTYGHAMGDAILEKVAETFKQQLRNEDVISRFGGEEFVALFRCSDMNEAFKVAERLRQAISAIRLPSLDRTVTASFGLVEFNPALNLEKNLNLADQLLYQSKEEGRNRVTAPQMNA